MSIPCLTVFHSRWRQIQVSTVRALLLKLTSSHSDAGVMNLGIAVVSSPEFLVTKIAFLYDGNPGAVTLPLGHQPQG